MINVTDKTNTDRILSHHGEIDNFDGSMTRYGQTMDSAKKYEIVSKDYDDARNININGEDGSHCSKNIDINPITSDNTSQVIDQNGGSDLKLQYCNGESSCYDKGKTIIHIYEETTLDNIFHDTRTGVEMIGIDVANTTSAKKDDIKADTSREIHLKNDLENQSDYIEGNIFVNPPFTKKNDIGGNISNKLDNLKSNFNNEINSNPETKFEHNTMTISDCTGINASNIFKGVAKESEVQNSNAKGGITITKEERSQRSTRSGSRSRSLPQISSSPQHLQKQQQQQQQRFHDILKESSSPSRKNNNTSSKSSNNDRRNNNSRRTSPTQRSPTTLRTTQSSVTTNTRGRRRSRSSSTHRSRTRNIKYLSSRKRNSLSPIINIVANKLSNSKSRSRTSRYNSHSRSRSRLSK